MINVRPVKASEWQTYRDLRLRALRESPDAFGSTYDSEVLRTDDEWARRIGRGALSAADQPLLVFSDGAPCGLLWCKASADEPGTVDLFQMWVDPAVRGSGAGRALMDEALDWSRKNGMQRIRLAVTLAQTPAMALYQAMGFRPEGEPELLREGSTLLAQAMVLQITE